jgi:hypothetical protein
LDNCIFDLADMALTGYVKNTTTEKYLLTMAKIRMLQGRYLESVGALDKLL